MVSNEPFNRETIFAVIAVVEFIGVFLGQAEVILEELIDQLSHHPVDIKTLGVEAVVNVEKEDWLLVLVDPGVAVCC